MRRRRYDMTQTDLVNPKLVELTIKKNFMGGLKSVSMTCDERSLLDPQQHAEANNDTPVTYTIHNGLPGFHHKITANLAQWGIVRESKIKNSWKVERLSKQKQKKSELMECNMLDIFIKNVFRVKMMANGGIHDYRKVITGFPKEPPLRDLFYDNTRRSEVTSFLNTEKIKIFSTNYPGKLLCYYDEPLTPLSAMCLFFIKHC